MRLRLCALIVLKEIRKENCRVAKMENSPRNSRHKAARFVPALESQSGLYAETSRDVWVVHEFVLLHGKVAIDGQGSIYFVQKCVLCICNMVRPSNMRKRSI